MNDLIRQIRDLLRVNVTDQSFYDTNNSKNVIYPYMTYSVDTEWYSNSTDEGTVDIDIFDNIQSYERIITLEQLIKDKFRLASFGYENFILRIDYVRSNTIPTADPLIKRRTVQMHIKVDWRN
ncbi:hypothetical protein [Leuconostoc citreum]